MSCWFIYISIAKKEKGKFLLFASTLHDLCLVTTIILISWSRAVIFSIFTSQFIYLHRGDLVQPQPTAELNVHVRSK